MAQNKKTENIVIGFDTQLSVVKILRNFGDDYRDVTIEHFDVDTHLMEQKQVRKLLDSVLAHYVAEHQIKQQDVYVVLPDYFITIDQITLPIMSRAKLKELVKMELKKTYPTYNDLEKNITISSKNKKQITYSATLVDKSILQDCIAICKKYNLNLRNISYESNCLVNATLALATKTKHTNFLVLNIQENQSKIIYVSHDKTICFGILPYGEKNLNTQNDNFNFLQNESLREVYNSTSTSVQSISLNSSTFEEMEKKDFELYREKYLQDQQEKQNYINTKTNSMFSFLINYAIGLQNTVVKNYCLPKPEILYVNMNSKLFESLTTNDEFDIKIQLLKTEFVENFLLDEYLELYGAIFAGTYNSGQNFLDKETKTKFSFGSR